MDILSRTIILNESAIAGANIDTKFGTKDTSEAMVAVTVNNHAIAEYPTEDGVRCRGFVMRRCAIAETAHIMTEGAGPVKVKNSQGINLYTPLRANSDGTVSMATSGDAVIGKAMTRPDKDGDIIQAYISAWTFAGINDTKDGALSFDGNLLTYNDNLITYQP